MFSDLGFGVVDVDYEYNVVKRLKIPRIPSIGAVFNGRSIIFDAEEYSVKNLRDFTRRLLPADLLQQVCFMNYLYDAYQIYANTQRVRTLAPNHLPHLEVRNGHLVKG